MGDSELAELDAMRRVRAQGLEQDTAVKLREARNLLTTDPDLARERLKDCLLYTSPSPRDRTRPRMPSSA